MRSAPTRPNFAILNKMADDNEKQAKEPTPKEIRAWDLVRRGMSATEAATKLDVSRQTVSNYVAVVQAWLGRDPIVAAARDEVERLAPEAATAYEEIIKDRAPSSINARLAAARDILKSTGWLKEPPKKFEGDLNLTVNEQVRKQIGNITAAIGADGDDIPE